MFKVDQISDLKKYISGLEIVARTPETSPELPSKVQHNSTADEFTQASFQNVDERISHSMVVEFMIERLHAELVEFVEGAITELNKDEGVGFLSRPHQPLRCDKLMDTVSSVLYHLQHEVEMNRAVSIDTINARSIAQVFIPALQTFLLGRGGGDSEDGLSKNDLIGLAHSAVQLQAKCAEVLLQIDLAGLKGAKRGQGH